MQFPKTRSNFLILFFAITLIIVSANIFVPKSLWKKIFSLNSDQYAAAFQASTSGDWNSTTTWGTNIVSGLGLDGSLGTINEVNGTSLLSAAFMTPSSNESSLSVWLFPTSPVPANGSHSYNKETFFVNGCINGQLSIDGSNSQIQYLVSEGTHYESSSTLNLDAWNHVVVISTSTGSQIFINGQDAGSSTQTWIGNDGRDRLMISGWCGNDLFQGLIAEYHFYNRALTLSEVSTLYNGGTLVESNFSIPNLLAMFHFDGDILDYSGNGYVMSGSEFGGQGLYLTLTGIPTSTDDITIDTGTVSLSQDQDVHSVILATGGTLELNGHTLNVYGNWTNTGGTLTDSSEGASGTINFVGTETQRILGTNTFPNLTKLSSTTSSLLFDPTATTTVAGNLFLSGSSGNLLNIAPSSGTLAPQFDSIILGTSSSPFGNPDGIVRDSSGNIYVSDCSINNIQEFHPDGTFYKFLDTTGMGNEVIGALNCPEHLAIDSYDNIYTVDYGDIPSNSGRIVKFVNGVYATSSPSITVEFGIAVGLDGFIYVGDYNINGIDKVDPDTFDIVASTTIVNGLNLSFDHDGMIIDPTGTYLYMADDYNGRIVKLNTSDLSFVSESFGPVEAPFDSPADVRLDSAGNIYVLNAGSSNVIKLASDYSFLTQWGTFGSGDGQFQNPSQIMIDPSNNIYVVDANRQDVQKFTQQPFTPFNIIHTGASSTAAFSFLNVSGSINTSADSFDCTDGCINGGSNTNWLFPAVARRTGGRGTILPSVSISASSNSVSYNSPVNISWNSQYANMCSLTKNGELWQNGTFGNDISSGNLTTDTVFTITCIGALRKEAITSVTITISGSSPIPASTTSPAVNPLSTTTLPTEIANHVFNKNLKLTNISDEIKLLQQLLNNLGYIIAQTGPGSPGNETNYFGDLTRNAIIRLQEANFDAILKPLKLTRGTGNFFEYTRAYVNSVLHK